MNDEDERPVHEAIAERHLRAGWWGLGVFLVMGVFLELFHAIKLPLYLDVGRETTRLLLRLAHAHGALVSLLNVAYALTVRVRPRAARAATSACFLASTLLLPGGFLLGGLWARGADPGVGVVLVPAGAALLLYAVIATGRAVGRSEA